ncbi:amidohydrolase family protein [Arthrobacter oryzae]|uniref:amidohydrolase family protein n=1 Tax=Arthrobacter oryzae TaxID=409290 RepID=UPI002854879F|nr:amidohydrolase family protein [Arthrobacter oryzae]MDR6505950.1 putative TIM-barrel fold metal-dependent hydrolase [Arthrobacter oryzae]
MAGGAFPDFVEQVSLIDHHVHGAFHSDSDEARFQNALNEGNNEPLAHPEDTYNTQIGLAIRRWCSPILDLPRHASPAEYWSRRSELGELEVSRRMTRAAGVSDWLIDTGLKSDAHFGPAGMAAVSGGRIHEIVRLEVVAESLIQEIANPADYVDEFGQRLHDLTRGAVGVKTVLAYRAGFDRNLSRPAPAAVTEAARRWQEDLRAGTNAKLTDVTLIAHGIHTAVSMKLPLQFHVGFGDRDLDLHKTNPLYLLDFLRAPEVRDTPIMLLHCYPFEREAGYLAHAFENVYLDVGLAVNFTGSRSPDLVARSLELAPFTKILYSSDAFGPAELHYLGARLWRNAITKVVGGWIDDDCSEADARKIVQLTAHDNARRVYTLT